LRVVLDKKVEKGERVLTSPFPNDEAVAIVDGDGEDLLLLTRWGRGVRFPNRSVESHGSLGLELDPDDEIAAALSLSSETQVLLATASGHIARYDANRIPSRTRPGGTGKPLLQARDALNVFPYTPASRLFYLTCSGSAVISAEVDPPLQQQSGPGTILHDLTDDPALAVIVFPG